MCGVGSWLLILLGLLMGLGRPGGLPRGRLGDWPCLVGLLLAGLVGCLVFGVGDTLSAACVWWWWVPPFLRAWCVWGWHAVGVLGQCALGCPARPGFHFLGFWVGVGGLVVNCIVDASILL